jgi:hypothetical protein
MKGSPDEGLFCGDNDVDLIVVDGGDGFREPTGRQ